ncbi:5-hydroxytryptamine receptor 1A-like [Amphiura filiformis]|uniref:5-hydroxytryptamine receptor 1A-like n=1 Tax=Amphiura filiformis TaxID=82378 RepID=UPI003B20F0D3
MTDRPVVAPDSGGITATTIISRDYISYTSESFETGYETVVQYITNPSTPPASGEEEDSDDDTSYYRPQVTVGILLGLMICLIALGNSLVVLAVVLERRLRTFENFFFASLAIADLSIALFVLPFCLTIEISGRWQFSYTACDMFIFTDVACCTSSILHLCTIGLNRYWSITSPLKYATKQTCRRACVMIACVWALSFIIACPPLFGWPKRNREIEDHCDYDVDIFYVIYSSCGSFYIPLIVMTVVYIQIFRLSKKGARFRRLSSYQCINAAAKPGSAQASPKGERQSLQRKSSQASGAKEPGQRKESFYEKEDESQGRRKAKLVALICPSRIKKERAYKRRQAEAKTAKTLGIIMGAFVLCWLPFFILYVIKPLCGETCQIPIVLERFALWLGYFNSLLNPVIYICCKPLFRITFKRILTLFYCRRPFGHHRRHEMHYFRGRHQKAVASWGCPVAPDNSLLRRHQEHPEEFGAAFSDGYREKREGGLRQMPLKEYAEEFHHEKCKECQQDVDPLDSSGVNQDIDDYLNYVLTNGYLRPDLCKDIGIRELLSPHKCKTSSGNTKYHCGHCCKGQIKDTSSQKGTSEKSKNNHLKEPDLHNGIFDKSKKSSGHSSSSYHLPTALNCSTFFSSHKRSSQSGKSKSMSELARQEGQNKVEKEAQSSPSTENTLMQTTTTRTSPTKDSIQGKSAGDVNIEVDGVKKKSAEDICHMTSSPSVSLKREMPVFTRRKFCTIYNWF